MFTVITKGINTVPFQHFSINSALNEWGADVGPLLQDAVRSLAPVRTGRLRSSIAYSMGAGGGGGTALEMRITAYGVPYAGYVVSGTGAHEIEPHGAKALHFQWHGQDVFFSHVNHPGTKANPFPRQAYQDSRDMMMYKMLQYVADALAQS